MKVTIFFLLLYEIQGKLTDGDPSVSLPCITLMQNVIFRHNNIKNWLLLAAPSAYFSDIAVKSNLCPPSRIKVILHAKFN